MALKIQRNQKSQSRYKEIVACVLEEKGEGSPQDHEKAVSRGSSSGKSEVQ